jgi:hypothetical protein
MQFFTVNGAAEALERDRRTIGRALRDVPPDDETNGRRWKLATIVNALKGREDYSPRNDAAVDEIEAAHEALAAGLKRLQKTASIDRRRQIASDDVGKLVGRLDAAMERAAAGRKPHERALLGIARDKIIGDAIGAVLGACEWEVRS